MELLDGTDLERLPLDERTEPLVERSKKSSDFSGVTSVKWQNVFLTVHSIWNFDSDAPAYASEFM
jgi:hypothetical protein